MRVFNYYVQVFILFLIVLILISSLFEVGYIILIFYLQFFVGIYQFLFGAFLAIKNEHRGLFRRYFFLALASLMSFTIFLIIDNDQYEWLFGILFAGVPWALAIYYGLLSHRYYKES